MSRTRAGISFPGESAEARAEILTESRSRCSAADACKAPVSGVAIGVSVPQGVHISYLFLKSGPKKRSRCGL